MLLLEILGTIVLPLFLLMAIGYFLDKRFNLDVRTLSRIQFYVISPVLLFTVSYEAELNLHDMAGIAGFTMVHLVILLTAALLIYTLRPFRDNRALLTVGTLVTNAGNYGLPLTLLAFGEESVSAVGIMLSLHSLLFFSLGLTFLVGTKEGGLGEAIKQTIRYPVLHAILLGFLLRALHVSIPTPIQTTLDYVMGAFVSSALITLGVQLSKCPAVGDAVPVSMLSVMRFLISPLLAALLVPLFNLPPPIAGAMILAAALPTAVNVYIAAAEVDRGADLASRMVFWTTIGSAVVIPLVLLFVRSSVP